MDRQLTPTSREVISVNSDGEKNKLHLGETRARNFSAISPEVKAIGNRPSRLPHLRVGSFLAPTGPHCRTQRSLHTETCCGQRHGAWLPPQGVDAQWQPCPPRRGLWEAERERGAQGASEVPAGTSAFCCLVASNHTHLPSRRPAAQGPPRGPLGGLGGCTAHAVSRAGCAGGGCAGAFPPAHSGRAGVLVLAPGGLRLRVFAARQPGAVSGPRSLRPTSHAIWAPPSVSITPPPRGISKLRVRPLGLDLKGSWG